MNFWIFLPYLLVMSVVTYLVRTVPFVLIRKKIRNRFIRSFLAYIPCAVLSAMTFPAVFYSTNSFGTALVATVGAAILSFVGADLTLVALSACLLVYLAGFFL